jgi:hypothetical protein
MEEYANMFDGKTYVFTVGTILLFLLGLIIYRFASHTLPLPPGPPGKLISGNVHQLPKGNAWQTYAKWAETYGLSSKADIKSLISDNDVVTGPVISFRVFQKRYVVLNSPKAVVDLLENRSSIYSDRPKVSPVFCGCF